MKTKIIIPGDKFLNRNQGKTKACTMYAITNALYCSHGVTLDPIKLWSTAQSLSPDGDDIDGLSFPEIKRWAKSQKMEIANVPKNTRAFMEVLSTGTPICVSVKSSLLGKKSDNGHAIVCRGLEIDSEGKWWAHIVNSWNPLNNYMAIPFFYPDGSCVFKKSYTIKLKG